MQTGLSDPCPTRTDIAGVHAARPVRTARQFNVDVGRSASDALAVRPRGVDELAKPIDSCRVCGRYVRRRQCGPSSQGPNAGGSGRVFRRAEDSA